MATATHQIIDAEKTFTPVQAEIVVKEYACAICYGRLTMRHIPNESRMFVECPLHGNVCDCGRVTHATAAIALENAYKGYYKAISAFPDLWGGLWKQGVKRDHAAKIVHESVCALCGRMISMSLILKSGEKRINTENVTLSCPTHGDVGTNGWGFVKTKDYKFIPPIEEKAALRAAASRGPLVVPDASNTDDIPVRPFFTKLGSVGIGDRFEKSATDHFTVVFIGKKDNSESKFRRLYKKNPDELNIRLPGRTLTDIFYMPYQCYRQGGLVASAETSNSGHLQWKYFRDPETFEVEISGGIARTMRGSRMLDARVETDQPIYQDANGNDHFIKASAKLQMCISELTEINGTPNVGYFELNLNTESDINTLYTELLQHEKIGLKQGLNLAGMKFVLSRRQDDTGYAVHLDGLIG